MHPNVKYFEPTKDETRFHNAPLHAVLLSPITSMWDEGEYFSPIIKLLQRYGYSVSVYDTLSLIHKNDRDIYEVGKRWAAYLSRYRSIDLFVGAALGGTIVQELISISPYESIPASILISSPTFVDNRLASKMQTLADMASFDSANSVEERLAWLVDMDDGTDFVEGMRVGNSKNSRRANIESIIKSRFERGFRILSNFDARSSVRNYKGKLLHLYGLQSRLVQECNIAVSDNESHSKIGIDQCGMRPLSTATEVCMEIVTEFLEKIDSNQLAGKCPEHKFYIVKHGNIKDGQDDSMENRYNDSVRLIDAAFIDIHYHANPDMYIRRHNAIDAGRRYKALNGWVVLKNHLGCTVAQAYEARMEGYPVSGSLVLNEIVGGIDWRIVERSLSQIDSTNGRLIVHLPTVVPTDHRSILPRHIASPILEKSPLKTLEICDERGQLLDSVKHILRIAKDYPVVISSGHTSRDHTFTLIDSALSLGVPRLLLNQPANPITGLSAATLKEVSTAENVFIEQSSLTRALGYQAVEDFAQVVSFIPRVIFSSDYGQPSSPDVDEWFKMASSWFSDLNLSSERIDEITRKNPLFLLT